VHVELESWPSQKLRTFAFEVLSKMLARVQPVPSAWQAASAAGRLTVLAMPLYPGKTLAAGEEEDDRGDADENADRDALVEVERDAAPPALRDRESEALTDGDALGLPHTKLPSANVWKSTLPSSVKLANVTPLASSTSSSCPAMNDDAVPFASLMLLIVMDESATGVPRSICRNSLAEEPPDMKLLLMNDFAKIPSTANTHRDPPQRDPEDVQSLPSATLASPDADTATISST
jgi:hypothetical protein